MTRVRWGPAFAAAFALHAGVGATVMFARAPTWEASGPAAAILVDLAPAPTKPPEPATELPPGPEQMASEPKPEPAPKPDPLPEAPPTENAEAVIAPPELQESDAATPEDAAEETTAPPTVEAPPDDVAATPAEGAQSLSTSARAITWQSAVLGRLERFKRYPRDARRNRQEGVVDVRMTIDRAGNVLDREIERTSGVYSLDAEALALIDRAQPLPTPPEEVEGDAISLVVPIEFYMKR